MSTKSITQILEFLDNRGIPEQEISYADRFDYVVINDDLQQAIAEVETLVAKFIKE